jgi:methionyl-tRNA formyltransferase
MKTIFLGTPQFAIPSLQYLALSNHKPLMVITQPDRPKGRKRQLKPPEIKLAAQKLDIPVFQPEDVNLEENLEKIIKLKPDLIITVAYGGYLRKKIRSLPRYGSINIHPSLLPLYRGAAPINYALFNGDLKTGISIFQLAAKMDAGPVLWQREVPIEQNDNYTTLSDRLAKQGALDLLQVVDNIQDLINKKTHQNNAKATFSHKIEKKDTFIQWNQNTETIHNRIRGLAETPGAVAGFRDRRIKIIEAETVEGSKAEAGFILESNKNGILIATKGSNLLVKRVQPEGKKIMTAQAFDLGARISKGEKFTDGF